MQIPMLGAAFPATSELRGYATVPKTIGKRDAARSQPRHWRFPAFVAFFTTGILGEGVFCLHFCSSDRCETGVGGCESSLSSPSSSARWE